MTSMISPRPQLITVYMTPEQVAVRMQVTRETVYRWLRRGRLNGSRISRNMWRVTEDQLVEFLKGGEK